jgi:hypothetical protein
LEHFRIPKAIREERGSSIDKLRIFRDVTDLEAGGLYENIKNNLEKSAKLIVICSTDTFDVKNNQWISAEVQHFIDCGRSVDILPLVINGEWQDEPEFNKKNNTMPKNLQVIVNELFVCSYNDVGKRMAYLKVLSGVLRTSFGILVQREKKRKRNNVAAIAVASIAIVLLIIIMYHTHHIFLIMS